jgi:4-methoxybenzoate monooxygenase (O-demethylating)
MPQHVQGENDSMPSTTPMISPDYDMFSREAIRDPQTHDAVVRESAPVVYMPKYDVWATGRHDQIELMMRDWKTFSSTRPAFQKEGRGILLSEDPPEHTRLRTVMHRGISPAVLRAIRTTFEEAAENLVESLLSGPEEIDGHTDLAKAYVLKVFPDALGLGEEGRENLVRFGHVGFNSFGPDNEILRESIDSSADVFDWIEQNLERDAVTPNGIAATLFEAADRGEITHEEATLLLRSLYSAGSDTTIYAIGNTLKALAASPEQWELLRQNPEMARPAFEEGIRYDNPARYTRRTTNEAVDVEGVALPADAKILLLHMPGGRDPRRWEDPETYDIRRDVVGKHLGLGFGIHVCVGAPVARLEAVSLLNALTKRVRSIEPAGEPEGTENMAVHGHQKLPLRLVAA